MKAFGVCFLLIAAVLVYSVFLASPDSIPETRGLTEISSADGVLDATMEATDKQLTLDGVTVNTSVYNDQYAAPLLRVRPGDRMRIRLINHTSGPTNIHFHGIETSPLGNGDNVHVNVEPGQTFDYDVRVSKDQAPGLYWYHDHTHGIAEKNVMRGLSGALEVEGIEDVLPQLARLKQRVFVLKDYEFPESKDPHIVRDLHRVIQTINGQTDVVLRMHPGETQFWRFSNQSPNRLFHLAVKGMQFRIVEMDGRHTLHETMTDVLTVLPASRLEVLVTAGQPGIHEIVTQNVMTGCYPNCKLERVQGKVIVSGMPETPLPAITEFPKEHDLRSDKIDATRDFVYSESADEGKYYINGQLFNMNRVDFRVPLGHVEEWTIRNDSDDFHTFHIHQLHFQVVEVNGKEVPFNGYVDNAGVPERSTVKVIIPFTDPAIVGTFIAHCHVLEHEDKGMMAHVEVYDPAVKDAASFFQPFADNAAPAYTNQDGKSVQEKDFRDKYMLVFFGFTHCMHVCHHALHRMASVMDVLKKQGSEVAPVFVSVDPMNDSPSVLQDYLKPFNGALTGLVGSQEQKQLLDKLHEAYRNRAAENDKGGKFPGTVHSDYIYLLDKQHKYVNAYAIDASAWYIAADIQKHLENGSNEPATDAKSTDKSKDDNEEDDKDDDE
ncbi:MAG TPA: SCO family protein [Rickettsiales bacterium]|nr:SCO family protein [Rickettsiales bacterium]